MSYSEISHKQGNEWNMFSAKGHGKIIYDTYIYTSLWLTESNKETTGICIRQKEYGKVICDTYYLLYICRDMIGYMTTRGDYVYLNIGLVTIHG